MLSEGLLLTLCSRVEKFLNCYGGLEKRLPQYFSYQRLKFGKQA